MLRSALFLILSSFLVSCSQANDAVNETATDIKEFVDEIKRYSPTELMDEAQEASNDILKYIREAMARGSSDSAFKQGLFSAVRDVHKREPKLKGREFLKAMVLSLELKQVILEKIDEEYPHLKNLPGLRLLVDQQVDVLSVYVMNPSRDVTLYLEAISSILDKDMFIEPQPPPGESENKDASGLGIIAKSFFD